MPELIRIDPLEPDPAALSRPLIFLRNGDVIAYPTETFYGLGADAGNSGGGGQDLRYKRQRPDKPDSADYRQSKACWKAVVEEIPG